GHCLILAVGVGCRLGRAGGQVGADLLRVGLCRVAGDKRHADVVDHVVTRGGDKEQLIVRGEGACKGGGHGRSSSKREIVQGAGTAAAHWLVVGQWRARYGASVSDERQVGGRRRNHLINGGCIRHLAHVEQRNERGISREREERLHSDRGRAGCG